MIPLAVMILHISICRGTSNLKSASDLGNQIRYLKSSRHLKSFPIGKSKWLYKMSFSWANDFMTKTRVKPIELNDLWKLDSFDTVGNITQRFEHFQKQNLPYGAKREYSKLESTGVFAELWSIQLIRTLVAMYVFLFLLTF